MKALYERTSQFVILTLLVIAFFGSTGRSEPARSGSLLGSNQENGQLACWISGGIWFEHSPPYRDLPTVSVCIAANTCYSYAIPSMSLSGDISDGPQGNDHECYCISPRVETFVPNPFHKDEEGFFVCKPVADALAGRGANSGYSASPNSIGD